MIKGDPEFVRSVNPIQTRGAGGHIMHHNTACPPPGFKKLPTPLLLVKVDVFKNLFSDPNSMV